MARLNEQAMQAETLLAEAKDELDSLRSQVKEFDVSALHGQQATMHTGQVVVSEPLDPTFGCT